MKTIKRLSLVFALIVAATISSCGGSDDAPAAAAIPATGSYINATADGAAFTTVINGVSAATCGRIGTGTDSMITILGSNVSLSDLSGQKSISITLRGVTAPGQFAVTTSSGSNLIYTIGSGAANAFMTGNCSGAIGTVTVTSISSSKIEGTFSFIGKNDGCSGSKSVTAGTFRGMFL